MFRAWAGLVVFCLVFTCVQCNVVTGTNMSVSGHPACDLVEEIVGGAHVDPNMYHLVDLYVCLASYNLHTLINTYNCPSVKCLAPMIMFMEMINKICSPPYVKCITCNLNGTNFNVSYPFHTDAVTYSVQYGKDVLETVEFRNERDNITVSDCQKCSGSTKPSDVIKCGSTSSTSPQPKTIWACRTTTVWLAMIALFLVIAIYIAKYVHSKRNHRIPRFTWNDQVVKEKRCGVEVS